jgi:hypothetical protein
MNFTKNTFHEAYLENIDASRRSNNTNISGNICTTILPKNVAITAIPFDEPFCQMKATKA